MLYLESIRLKRKVIDCEETSAHYKQTGIITFIEEKKGFRQSLKYFDITVKFDDGKESVYKEWMLRDPLEEHDTIVTESAVSEPEPPVNKKKKRQSAKRMPLTKVIDYTNLLTVHSEQPTNQPKEIFMNSNTSFNIPADADESVTESVTDSGQNAVSSPAAVRGRPVDPASAIHAAVSIIRALPVDQRKSSGKLMIQEQLDVKAGTAMVYYYNAIKVLREAGEHPEKVAATPKAKKAKAEVVPSANAAADETSTEV
jgi:hypothetical protein